VGRGVLGGLGVLLAFGVGSALAPGLGAPDGSTLGAALGSADGDAEGSGALSQVLAGGNGAPQDPPYGQKPGW